MDKLIESLFKNDKSENVLNDKLITDYINILNKSVNERNGKMVTGRELNEIYQTGGYYFLGSGDSTSSVRPTILDPLICTSGQQFSNGDPSYIISINTNSDIYGHVDNANSNQNNIGSLESGSNVNNINTPPEKSYGANNLDCGGFGSQCKDMSACTHTYPEPVTVNETNSTSILDTVSGWFGYNQNQPVAEMCGGGKKTYKRVSLNKINNILNKKAKFKMPKHHKIEFKNFIEFQINQ